MGRGQTTAESILYGKLRPNQNRVPAADARYQIANLNPENTGTKYGFFQDYRGWSGTDQWVVKTPSLPGVLIPTNKVTKGQNWSQQPQTMPDGIREFFQAVHDEDEKLWFEHDKPWLPRQDANCFYSADDNQFMDIFLRPTSHPDARASRAYIETVQIINELQGEWSLSEDYTTLYYFVDPDVTPQGMIQTSWRNRV